MNSNEVLSLDLRSLAAVYNSGKLTPANVIELVYERIEKYADPAVWTCLIPPAESLERAQNLMAQNAKNLPLYGVPFAIKDNIDLAHVPTTAGCPAFAYIPERSATVVKKLCAAGAIPIGKTNMDQFATGLVGTRTPYKTCRNPFDNRYIPGGSSSGSGVAVSAGLVSFALGTDTAGSGRVPAAFTNIVGLKPTRGLLSTRGVVPAVRSLDCVSIFALTCPDAEAILQVTAGFDVEDAFSRPAQVINLPETSNLRVGIPGENYLNFFENLEAEKRYREAINRLEKLGNQIVEIDFKAFAETAPLLYDGPWVAERFAAVGEFLMQNKDAVDPTVYKIISEGSRFDAVATFKSFYHLAELKRQAEIQWQSMDVLALPTTGTIYTVEEVQKEPFLLNRNLGLYTNFVNLLDLSAIAVPSGFQNNKLPTGITLMAPAWNDTFLCRLGGILHAELGGKLGATNVLL